MAQLPKGAASQRAALHAGKLERYASALIITPLSSSAEEVSSSYGVRPQGKPGTAAFRTFVTDRGADVSPWHDVALYNGDGSLNFVCEIPKNTTAKFEVATVRIVASQPHEGKVPPHHFLAVAPYCMLVMPTWPSSCRPSW